MPRRGATARYADTAAVRSLGLLQDQAILSRLAKRSNTGINKDSLEQRILADLLPYQRAFVSDFSHKYCGFCAGYGCVAGETLINGTAIKELTSEPIQVQTLAGPAWATPAYKKGIAELHRVQTEAGQVISVTKAHRFLTPFGWRELAHLRQGDLIAVRDNSRGRDCHEKSKDSSDADRVDFRSYDELHNPVEVFLREQVQQSFLPSIYRDPCLFGRYSDLCSSDSRCHADHHEALAQLLDQEKFSLYLRERQIYAPFLERQLHLFDNPLEPLPCSPASALSPSYVRWDFLRQLLQILCEGDHNLLRKHFADSSHCSRGDNLLYNCLFALTSTHPTGQTAAVTHPLSLRFSEQYRNFCRSLDISVLAESLTDAGLQFGALPSGSGLPETLALGDSFSHYTWSRVENIEYVRTDDFYDLHVPVLNHYEAHGILHHNSGKTFSAVAKQVLLCLRSPGFAHLFLEPTIPLIDDVALPAWFPFLEKYGIPHEFRRAPRPNITLKLPGGDTPVLLRSLENYQRLVGVNAASLTADEIDTTRADLVEKAIVKLQGRVRVGNCIQIATVSTPEGFGWMYNFFEKQKADNKVLYRGRSRDNPYLDPGFIEDLESKYHPELVKAYLDGEFVNLETATVFYEFIREKHVTGLFLPEPGERIVFGADFNVGQCHSVYAVVRPGPQGQQLHCFDDIKVSDTFALVAHLQKKYPRHLANRMITCYPDASGANTHTASTQSDHDILRSAGVQVVAERKNPSVAETLAHANVYIHRGCVLVNPTSCHDTIESLEQWAYDTKTMKPMKGGAKDLSHAGDAFRYLVWQVFPRAGMRAGYGPRWK